MKIEKTKALNRRQLIISGLASALASTTVAVYASSSKAQTKPLSCSKQKTPLQPSGPFYPETNQFDTDSDLIQVSGPNQTDQSNQSKQWATGEVIRIEGVVTDQHCNPVVGALVEIWQACHTGKYNHSSDPNTAELDPHFQYWGKAITDQSGHYRFRTIKPGSYPADETWVRPPHIHFKAAKLGYLELTTQMYFGEEKLNESDLILQRLSKTEQEKLIVALRENQNTEDRERKIGVFNISLTKLK